MSAFSFSGISKLSSVIIRSLVKIRKIGEPPLDISIFLVANDKQIDTTLLNCITYDLFRITCLSNCLHDYLRRQKKRRSLYIFIYSQRKLVKINDIHLQVHEESGMQNMNDHKIYQSSFTFTKFLASTSYPLS